MKDGKGKINPAKIEAMSDLTLATSYQLRIRNFEIINYRNKIHITGAIE